MKDKKLLVLVVFSASLIFIILFVSRSLNLDNGRVHKSPSGSHLQEGVLVGLKTELSQTKDLIHAFVKQNVMLQDDLNKNRQALEQERAQAQSLQQRLKEALAQIDSLNQQLSGARVSFDFTDSIRQKLREVDTSLANLWVKPRQEKELSQQLKAIEKELDSIDRSIPELIKENKSYKQQAQDLNEQLRKKAEESAGLSARLKQEQEKGRSLERDFSDVSAQLKAANNARALVEKKTLDLRTAMDALRQNNLSLGDGLAGLEKELKEAKARFSKEQAEKDLALRQRQEAIKKIQEAVERQMQQQDALARASQLNQSHEKKIDSLNSQLKDLEKDRRALEAEREESRESVERAFRLQKEYEAIKLEFDRLNREYTNLKQQFSGIQATLAQNETDLAKRADRILNLQEKLADTEARLAEIQLKSNELQKECALLREQNVGVQLEREVVKSQLEEANQRLGSLQQQLSRIGDIVKIPEEGPGAGQQEGAKKVDVQLMPQPETGVRNE